MMESSGEITTHLTSGAVVVYVLEWLKGAGWFPWLTASTKTLNRFLSALTAAGVALGIHLTYDAQTGTAVITGLTAGTIALTFWEWLKQFITQQMIYDGVVQKSGGK